MTQPDAARVVLDGILGIRTIATLRETLRAALAEHPSVSIDCAAAESIDLSFIQLLLAARRSARQAGRPFVLSAPADGALRATLEQGGFLPAVDADPFWSGEP